MSRSRQSTITIRDLLETSSLQLAVLAGGNGLDRSVTWTHVSELPNPAPWLDGGELLMTNGLGLAADGAAQARLIEQLDERRAAGLALGVRGPELQPELVAEAERRAFPVLAVPLEVPFLSIARMVADANQNSAQQRLLTHVRIFDTLRPGDDPAGAQDIFARLEEISGYRLHLVSATGAPLFGGFRRPPDDVLEALAEESFGVGTSHPAVPGGYAVPVPIEGRAGTYLVALERAGAEPAGLGAVRHMATIAALELSKLYHEREAQRRRGAEIIAKLFAGRLDPSSTEAALLEAGFDPAAPLVVAALRSPDGMLDDDEIHHRLCDLEVPCLLLLDGDLFAVLPAEPNVVPEVVAGLPLCAGVSRERVGMHAWSLARKEALWALERAIVRREDEDAVLRFSQAESSVHWLPTDIGTLENLVQEILSPVMEYDVAHNSTMLQSLQVFFAHNRRLQSAADELFVHKHTLSYRLQRVEQITGRDLSRMEDLVQLWLAVQAYEVVGAESTHHATS